MYIETAAITTERKWVDGLEWKERRKRVEERRFLVVVVHIIITRRVCAARVVYTFSATYLMLWCFRVLLGCSRINHCFTAQVNSYTRNIFALAVVVVIPPIVIIGSRQSAVG